MAEYKGISTIGFLLCLVLPPTCVGQQTGPGPKSQLFPISRGFEYGYIDRTGKIVVAPSFRFASDFMDGLGQVQTADGKIAYVDVTGHIAFSMSLDLDGIGRIGDFNEGLAAVKVAGRYGFMNHSGKMVIAPRFDDAGRFSGGLGSVEVDGKLGFIDRSGKVVIEPAFKAAQGFSEGLSSVQTMDLKWGFIDTEGHWAIRPEFDYAGDFNGGLAAVVTGGKLGFVDKTGKIVIPLEFEGTSFGKYTYFSEGLAAVCVRRSVSDKWGYVDARGAMVVQPQFYYAAPFSEGRALVAVGDFPNVKWGFIDKTGALVIPSTFVKGESFRGGLQRCASKFFRAPT